MKFARSKKSTFLLSSVVAVAVLLGSMFFALQKPISIQVDGKEIHTRVLFTGTVEDVLSQQSISLGTYDTVQPSVESPIKKDMKIIVNRAFKIKVLADGVNKEIYTTPVSVKEAIVKAGFTIGDKDIIKTQGGDKVCSGQEIEVIRVSEQEITEEEGISFQVQRVDDPTLEKGLTKTVTAGKDGITTNTIKVTYYNGVEQKREIVKSEPKVLPQARVIAMGSITEVSRGGQRLNIREARIMTATAYTYTGYRTATGRNPAVGMVAVDPGVIPLGSRLYIECYGYAIAADTGGAIKGNILDLFMEQHGQCVQWGRRSVKVYVLN